MRDAVNDVLRLGPAIVLAITVAGLTLATHRTSRAIGGRAYSFGRSIRQTLTRLLFAAAVVGGLVALSLHAAGSASAAFAPLAGEASAVSLGGLAMAIAGQILTVVARSEMGRPWRVGIPDEASDVLLRTGLFSIEMLMTVAAVWTVILRAVSEAAFFLDKGRDREPEAHACYNYLSRSSAFFHAALNLSRFFASFSQFSSSFG